MSEKVLLLCVMARREETSASSGVETARVAMSGGEAVVGSEVEGLAVGVGVEAKRGEPLLPLQDSWYYSTSLFLVVRATKVSPPGTLKKWILKAEAPNHETVWVLATFSVMDLQFQQKEFLPVLIQFLCPCGTTSGWSN